jgi:hypothetical protein
MKRPVFWLGGGTIFLISSISMGLVMLGRQAGRQTDRQTDRHTAEPPVPELSAFDVEMTTEKLKGH